ncbi:hypothetical protein [Paenibacillus sp. QZ-Y1]|uniref:hypothetical protein n=1 Tax=Paenibacillus sp. QZ-Y1 TaxID=3414511 RepID=UPI003F7A6992
MSNKEVKKFDFDFHKIATEISEDVLDRSIKQGDFDFLKTKHDNGKDNDPEFEKYKLFAALLTGLSTQIAEQTLHKYHNELAGVKSIALQSVK